MATQQLECTSGNYQCGGRCLPEAQRCNSQNESTKEQGDFAKLVSQTLGKAVSNDTVAGIAAKETRKTFLASEDAKEKLNTLAGRIKDAVVSRDMAVNTGGTLGSIVGGAVAGPLGALGGDFLGALAVRGERIMADAIRDAHESLRDTAEFKSAKPLGKAKQLAKGALASAKANRDDIEKELTADTSGFAIGNISASVLSSLPVIGGVPLKGAIAASILVPQVLKAREHLKNKQKPAALGEAGMSNSMLRVSEPLLRKKQVA